MVICEDTFHFTEDTTLKGVTLNTLKRNLNRFGVMQLYKYEDGILLPYSKITSVVEEEENFKKQLANLISEHDGMSTLLEHYNLSAEVAATNMVDGFVKATLKGLGKGGEL